MLDNLFKYGKCLSLTKAEHLFSTGDADGNFYILSAGLLKVYYITSEGKEFVKSFIREGGYIASINAMMSTGVCPFNVVALEDSEIQCIPKATMLSFQSADTTTLKTINLMLLQLVQKKEKREHELLCLSATERYQAFKNEYSDLEARVSQYDIARYLGITPVALSRIRNRL